MDDGRARRREPELRRQRLRRALPPGGGSQAVALGDANSPTGQLIGAAAAPVQGVQPKYPGKRPPYVSSVRCHKSKIPDVNGSWAAKGPGEGVTP